MSPIKKMNSPQKVQKVTNATVMYAVVFFLLILIAFHEALNHWFTAVLNLFSPVLLGLAFAYIMNPVFRFFERRVFSGFYPHALRRALSLLCTYLLFLLAFALLILMIVPQLFASLSDFIRSFDEHVLAAVNGINGFLGSVNDFLGQTVGKDDFFTPIQEYQFFDKLTALLNGALASVKLETLTSAAGSFFSAFADVIFALFISLYFLSSKEKRYAQVMKFRNALFSNETNKAITRLISNIDLLFGNFFEGRLIAALIVGTLLYVLFLIFGVPYAIILALFIALVSIIPYIGFVIGLVPATLIVLFTDYEKLIPFLIISLIIFQFDNNIISPKILGNNTGISSLCVIIAICVMGATLGLVGMLIAVPLFATVMDFGNSVIRKRLQKKRLPDDVENYYAPDPIIDPMRMNSDNSKNLLVALERRVLRANKAIESGRESDLTRTDRACMQLYRMARKIHILTDPSPETLMRLSTEELRKSIRQEVSDHVREYRTALASATADAKSGKGGEA